jgi:hypothetical protein
VPDVGAAVGAAVTKGVNRRVWVCQECGYREFDGPAEYHPYAFCVLVKAGLNPLTVVLDAVKALKVGHP